MKVEAEIRVMKLKPRGTKDGQEPLEAVRGYEGSFPRDYSDSMALVLNF